MKNSGKRRFLIFLFIVISVLLISVLTLFAVKFVGEYNAYKAEAMRLVSVNKEKEALELKQTQLNKIINELRESIMISENSINELNTEIDMWKNRYIQENEVLSELNEKNNQLLLEIKDKNFVIERYEEIVKDNSGYRSDLITQLITLLLKDAPMRTVEVAGQEDVPKEDKEYTKVYPKLAYYYYDLTTGYEIRYNSEEIMYSASVIKAPYVLAILKEVQKFEQNKHDFDVNGNKLYDSNGNPLFEGKHPNYDDEGNIIYLPGEEKYNLNTKWTYKKDEISVEGSGYIQYMADGTQLTIRELIEQTLLNSDNIAFKVLRDMYGYPIYYNLAAELNIKGTSKGFMDLSASDCVKYLIAINDFFEDGGEYGAMMKDCMIKSLHTVMICLSYPQGTVAHKYGWDKEAYHDIAIVFDENPYILVFMSDLDTGGDIVDAYIRKIVETTKSIHKSGSK